MVFVILALQLVVFLVALACFIIILVKMFQNGDTGIGVACAILAFCGIGFLIALVFGWINVARYGIQNVMYAYTGCFVVAFILRIVAAVVLNS